MKASELQNNFTLNELLKICISQSCKQKKKNVGFLQENRLLRAKSELAQLSVSSGRNGKKGAPV